MVNKHVLLQIFCYISMTVVTVQDEQGLKRYSSAIQEEFNGWPDEIELLSYNSLS